MDTPDAPGPDPSAPARAKLVRDRIPDIIRDEGRDPIVTVDLGVVPVFAKMREELSELELAIGTPRAIEEAADVWEAFRALLRRLGLDAAEVCEAVFAKRRERGGFDAGYILHSETDRP
jgi:predicted house-cleaning noncanonical NTP pyrophosphatase (MazG superfamily)